MRRSPRAAAAAVLPVLLLLNWAAAAGAATVAETRALLDFKAVVTADPGAVLANWTSGGDPCRDFAGVSCDRASGAVQRLRLHGEGLEGALSPSLSRLPALESVSLFGNHLSGEIPASFAVLAATLHKLNLSGNALSGEIPAFLGSFPFLRLLDLSYNAFSGEIPAALFGGCPCLRYVSLAHNALTGVIPPGIGGCVRLAGFDLSYNNLDGELPDKVCAPPELSYMSVRSNSLSGAIDDGKLAGCRSLDVFDVGSNNFSGDPPFGLLALVNITYFNVSSNNFAGEIPIIPTCGDRFAYLDASRNRLAGAVPETVANCRNLNFLDLSENELAGVIPPELGDLSNLAHFNVSFNNLTGSIPSSPLLQQFGPTAFMGNPLLCGPPLDNACPGRNPRRLGVPVIVAIVIAAAILVGICIISAMNIKAYKRRKNEQHQQEHDDEEEILVSDSAAIVSPGSTVITGKLVLFRKNSFSSRYEDWEAGTKAVLDKNCLVGVGSIGVVYRASFESGVSIAIKKLETLGRITSQEEFEHEIGRLRGISHPNLVTFHGYYWSPSTQLLLSEFVDNGSTLYDHLHGNRRHAVPVSSHGGLCWERRFKIAVATARALAYLHHDCKPQVLHLNIKSRNILLDKEHEAKLSDFGMVKLLPEPSNLNLHSVAVGYVAPEVASSSSSRYSDKCDVFSFGVVLLEIVTGRMPVSSGHGHGTVTVVLRDYVREKLESGTVSGCFDRSLRVFVEAELVQVLKLGLVCTPETPSRRPSMAEVVQFLESIRSSS